MEKQKSTSDQEKFNLLLKQKSLISGESEGGQRGIYAESIRYFEGTRLQR